jgi:peptidoglycan/xylan/chitin deacetylase (PgdA/CDA1 family)
MDLALLAQDQLVSVGAHSVTHPMLSRLPVDRQCDEIEGSKRHLEEALNLPVREFAYPHGDYSRATQEIVRDAGFTSACATNSGPVHSGTDLFALPRLHVYDLAGEEFAEWLHRVWGEA